MRFELGRVVATPGALKLLDWPGALSLIARHRRGDWGDLKPDDREANERALADGDRILSAYEVEGERVWVITEADRSSTCVLLAREY